MLVGTEKELATALANDLATSQDPEQRKMEVDALTKAYTKIFEKLFPHLVKHITVMGIAPSEGGPIVGGKIQ